jgi:hypothetical protein
LLDGARRAASYERETFINVFVRSYNKHAGTYKLEYLPAGKGIYEVSVRVGGIHISGSPFSAEVLDSQEQAAFYASRKYTTVEGPGRAMMTVGVLNSFIGKYARM